MAFDFSITQDRFTPIRPQKIEKLFNSPLATNVAPRIVNDLTYQIQDGPPSSVHKYLDIDNTIGLDHVDHKLLRQSTCLKIDQPLIDKTNLHQENETAATLQDSIVLNNDDSTPQYRPFYQYKDSHPVRAACFHPNGEVFAVGTNSRSLHLFMYPSQEELQNFHHNCSLMEPELAFKLVLIHRGSVYCAAFNQAGNMLATGSNDQTVHVVKYNSVKKAPEGAEKKLMHTGTIRDLCFLNDGTENNSTLLATAGAGGFEVNLFDCTTMKRLMKLHGHESTVMSLHHWDDSPTFVSCSLDGTIRMWDVRSKRCSSLIGTTRQGGDEGSKGTPVGVVRIEPTGKLLVSGHVDGRCMLYDVRGGKVVQLFKAHDDEIRTLNFSPKSYYLLTGGYDHKVKLMDLQGDLTRKLPTVEVAQVSDKIVQTAWHPSDYTFVTTSADGTATLWTMPELLSNNIL